MKPTLQHLLQYIESYKSLTGSPPNNIPVSQETKEWYAKELALMFEDFGVKELTGTKVTEPQILKKKLSFKGIELAKV